MKPILFSPKPVDVFVQKVEQRLSCILSDEPPFFSKISKEVLLSPQAKRIRPRLVFLFGQIFDEPQPSWFDLACASELIHSASLFHDDVIDEAKIRRGTPSANSKWGNSKAILTGDWLLSVSLKLLHPISFQIHQELFDVFYRMTQAAMTETSFRDHWEMNFSQWRSMAMDKTSSLFEWCAKSPLLEKISATQRDQMGKCASHLGIAFQMVDDVKDFELKKSSKDSFSDLQNQNPNFILLLAFQNFPSLKKEIIRFWKTPFPKDTESNALSEKLLHSEVFHQGLKKIQKEIDKSMDFIRPFLSSLEGKEIEKFGKELFQEALHFVSCSQTHQKIIAQMA